MNLTIGSGDVAALMAGKNTKTFGDLMRKFVDENKPYYNALASPIDALRAGAILEKNYLLTLGDDYFTQYKVQNNEMDVFISSLDFAKISGGAVVDFDELKTISLPDFIDLIEPLRYLSNVEQIAVIKKKFKKYYEQVQIQLFCSNLESANLVFLSVDSYVDEVNFNRVIEPKDYAKFRIPKDNEIIEKIKEKGIIFQTIKDYLK